MGKRSRERRTQEDANPTKAAGHLLLDLHAFQQRSKPSAERIAWEAKSEAEFDQKAKEVSELFERFDRFDLAIALVISDLWPANVASQVKHIFALRTLLGLSKSDGALQPISDYGTFQSMLTALHAAWPEFPTLEDYAPTADWGQTKALLGQEYAPMFYGGSIERTPDFVEAFRMSFADTRAAQNDMDLAVSIQADLIRSIERLRGLEVVESNSDDVQVPPADFWKDCRAALLGAGERLRSFRSTATATLVHSLDASMSRITWKEFGDAAPSGTAIPYLALETDGRWLPVAVRNAPGVVVDHWAATRGKRPVSRETHLAIGRFVADRLRRTHVGPFRFLLDRALVEGLTVSCLVPDDAGVLFVCAVDRTSLPAASEAASKLYKGLRRGAKLELILPAGQGMSLQRSDGKELSSETALILIVPTQGGTEHGFFSVPGRPARLMPMADLVTLFDSVEDMAELLRFWVFVDEQRGSLFGGMTSLSDLFGAFRDTHGVLIEGATSPHMMAIDPHWGSRWRFEELSKFWQSAPSLFPDGSRAWEVTNEGHGIVTLHSKASGAIAYCVRIGDCEVQTLIVAAADSRYADIRMAGLFAELIADRLYRWRDAVSGLPLFQTQHLVLRVVSDPRFAVAEDTPPEALEAFSQVVTEACDSAEGSGPELLIDGRAVLAGLNRPSNACFEVRCVLEALTALCRLRGFELEEGVLQKIEHFGTDRPRFHLQVLRRNVDVPDHVEPVVPTATDFKLARKQLAIVMRGLDLEPGRYELAQAKIKIDASRDGYRGYIEAQLGAFSRSELLQACIEQHDACLIAERVLITRMRQSLNHEVQFDRLEAVEEARRENGGSSKNYRYLIEKLLTLKPTRGRERIRVDSLRKLVALVDWYLVLAHASDVLHTGVDVGGIEISSEYVPEVFYSAESDERDALFARQFASSRLGIGIEEEDVVEGSADELLDDEQLQKAFRIDLGFELGHLVAGLELLSQAKRHGLSDTLQLSYAATPKRLAAFFEDGLIGLDGGGAATLVEFLTLRGASILRLEGKTKDETDVPFWEYSKRTSRYAIRPLVPDGDQLRWGAEQASRASLVWKTPVRDGYIPADFDWPHVVPLIRQVQKRIETGLEFKAEEIFKRYAPFVRRGADFKRNFPSEGFDDVGDYDVLAYWPDTNTLVACECKYIQPAYTMKDARRLRDKIYRRDSSGKASHIIRVEARRKFLAENRQRMLELLKWPVPATTLARDVELYVSRDVYFWMVNPPYEVPTEFVRIDGLDTWIRQLEERMVRGE